MKIIVLIGVMSLVALGIFAVLSSTQRQATDQLVQAGDGAISEKKREIALANTIARETFNEPNAIKYSTPVPGPSWLDPFQNAIEHCLSAIKNLPTSLGHLAFPHKQGQILLPPQITGNREDFRTINGRQYKDSKVTSVEPDGIVVKYKLGITKLYFVELPKEVQERFHYNPQQAAGYAAEQAANYEVYQKQQEEIRRRQEEEYARNYVAYLQQQAANRNAQALADQVLIQEQQNAFQPANQPDQSTHLNGNAAISLLPVMRPQPSSPQKK